MMWTTRTPRLSMKPRMNSGNAAPGIKSGRFQISSAYGSTWCNQRFGDGVVVINDGAQRVRLMFLNQSIVPRSEPPRSTQGAM